MKIGHSKSRRVRHYSLMGLTSLALLAVASSPVISRDGDSTTDSVTVNALNTANALNSNPHDNQLRKDMLSMSASVLKLFALDNMDNIDDAERQRQILQELDKLEKTARILVNDVEIKNYSIRSPFMGSFLHDVGMAREFALMDPPDFRPSTGLIKSCLLCHENLDSGQ